ncbi:MAG: hypothetical protein ACK55Z_36550, partial [bacterium]
MVFSREALILVVTRDTATSTNAPARPGNRMYLGPSAWIHTHTDSKRDTERTCRLLDKYTHARAHTHTYT